MSVSSRRLFASRPWIAALALALAASPALASPSPEPELRGALEAALVDALVVRHHLGPEVVLRVDTLRPVRSNGLDRATELVGVELRGGSRLGGPITFEAHIRRAVKTRGARARVETVWMRAKVRAEAPAVVARRDVKRGEQLTPGDLAVELRALRDGLLTDPGAAVGRVTRRALREGDPVMASLIRLPDAVRRGDSVSAFVQGARFRIRTRGEALGRGGVGEEVMVRIQHTKKLVVARVLAPGEVEVLQ